MPQNFLRCDHDQVLLLPPNLRDWLPEGHLASFLLDTVDSLDLDSFYLAYRADGHGRAAHDPASMVALLLYTYCRGLRSSRAIERSCWDDVGCRVIMANQQPDHATIARFRQRHEDPVAGLFSQGMLFGLCTTALCEMRAPTRETGRGTTTYDR